MPLPVLPPYNRRPDTLYQQNNRVVRVSATLAIIHLHNIINVPEKDLFDFLINKEFE